MEVLIEVLNAATNTLAPYRSTPFHFIFHVEDGWLDMLFQSSQSLVNGVQLNPYIHLPTNYERKLFIKSEMVRFF